MRRVRFSPWIAAVLVVILLANTNGYAVSAEGLSEQQLVDGTAVFGYASEDVPRLNARQERLILDYMELYYQSLADLKAASPAGLFAAGAQHQALINRSAWQSVIDIRGAQKLDLSLKSYSYRLSCDSVGTQDNGDLSVSVTEDAVQRFTAFPGVDSESYNVRHRFTLAQTAGGWKLRSHSQMDSASRVALGRYRNARDDSGGSGANLVADLAVQRKDILAVHTAELARRNLQFASYQPGAEPSLTWTRDYDRDAAVAYAMKWVENRNTDSWPVYDRNGGNCANFTSQCLLAGGVPMDIGGSQWKWYGPTPNNTSQTASGRSASWSGVNEFYAYASQNSGYGMVAEPDANFWSGQPGDLIQLGFEGRWRHIVIITDVIRDRDGNPVDYLINSNTADQRRFPVSAYLYPQQRLIKIYGWNE